MTIIVKPVSSINPYKNNPRKNDNSVAFVKDSIREFGFREPIVIDHENTIVCGHTRYKAAVELEMKEIPCVLIDDLTEKQIKEYRIADNATAGIAIWDKVLLAKELDRFNSETKNIGFDSGDEGFEFKIEEINDIEEPEGIVEYLLIFDDPASRSRFDSFMRTLKKDNPDMTKGEALVFILENELYE